MLRLQLEQLQTAMERSLSTASYSSYGGEEEAAGEESCRESSQPSASVSGFVTSAPVGTMGQPLSASGAIFSWPSGSIQWTLVNPDRVNPKPRKSEVQNQLINN